ncbi:MAG: cobalamin biosynthesis protein CobD [Rhodospirillales bacterium]|nr:cobalamin biosynthesis protein CobD [Rhodospirillales bacterium]
MPIAAPLSAVLPFHPLLLLLAALALEPVLGEARGVLARLPHPVRGVGAVVAALDRKLNREERRATDRRLRGVLLVVFVAGLAGGVGIAVSVLARLVPYGWVGELVVVITLLAQRSLFRHVLNVVRALQRGGVEAGRAQVALIVGRDVRRLDAHGVARAAIESCAENFSDAVVAPTFWFVLFGLPGMLVYKAVNTMDSMVGYRSERYRAFGWAAARLDDALNLVPARLAGVMLGAAAIAVPRASVIKGVRVMLRDARKHRSPNSGFPEAAMAGALGLSLAGPRCYPGLVVDDPWIGDGTARATAQDVGRALALFAVACVLNGAAVAAIAAACFVWSA